MFSEEFIKRIPKTDVHVHLDGSIRLSTLIDLAKERGVELPAFTEKGLKESVFKDNYKNLDEYLTGFAWTTRVLQDAAGLERVAYELAYDNFEEGVFYLEVRFAPQLHINDKLTFDEVMHAVDRGLRTARDEINSTLPAGRPRFEYGIIVCAMRFFNEHFSSYYRGLTQLLSYASERELFTMASLELARATVKIRRDSDVQVVAFDLAGSEHGYPAAPHQAAFSHVHRNFLKKTVHAGEAYGPESIFQAITKLHADRIGHGLRLFDEGLIHSEEITDKARYIDELANFIADKRITIEVCLTSNMQTSPDLRDIKSHSLAKMLERNMSLTFCTDNRLVSNTTVSNEIKLALDNFKITPKQLKNFIIYGFKRSFYYRPYADKRRYVRQIIDYYEMIEQEHGIDTPAS